MYLALSRHFLRHNETQSAPQDARYQFNNNSKSVACILYKHYIRYRLTATMYMLSIYERCQFHVAEK